MKNVENPSYRRPINVMTAHMRRWYVTLFNTACLPIMCIRWGVPHYSFSIGAAYLCDLMTRVSSQQSHPCVKKWDQYFCYQQQPEWWISGSHWKHKWAVSYQKSASRNLTFDHLTAHALPFGGSWSLVLCLALYMSPYIAWMNRKHSGEAAQLRNLAWTFPVRIYSKSPALASLPK